jgi:hypothetical protein
MKKTFNILPIFFFIIITVGIFIIPDILIKKYYENKINSYKQQRSLLLNDLDSIRVTTCKQKSLLRDSLMKYKGIVEQYKDSLYVLKWKYYMCKEAKSKYELLKD